MAYQNPDALKELDQAQQDLGTVANDLQIFNQDPLSLPPEGGDVVLTAADGSVMGSMDFSSPLSFEPLGIVINSAGHIRSGQSKYNTGKGWWIGSDNNTAKLSIGDPASRSLTWDGTNLTINGYVQSGIGAFGGDGSDGALNIPSGTTTINLGGLTNVTKNYSSIIIAAGATLAFSNPHANGTVFILKSQGIIQIAGTVTMQAAGAQGGASQSFSWSGSSGGFRGVGGSSGNIYELYLANTNAGSGGGVQGESGPGGAVPTLAVNTNYYTTVFNYAFKYANLWTGAGGGSGCIQGTSTNGSGTSGAGGAASGSLLIECAGAWNFTGTINAAGNNGGDGVITSGGTQFGIAGGGGGAGGLVFVLYNTLTANSGTYTVTGGTGGLGKGSSSVPNFVFGGGGGATLVSAGSNGGQISNTPNFSGQTGGNGANGIAFVAKNNLYA